MKIATQTLRLCLFFLGAVTLILTAGCSSTAFIDRQNADSTTSADYDPLKEEEETDLTTLSLNPSPREVVRVAFRNNLSLSEERGRTGLSEAALATSRGVLDPRLTGLYTSDDEWSGGVQKEFALGTSLAVEHGTLIGRELGGAVGLESTPRATRVEIRQPLLAGLGNGSGVKLAQLELSAQNHRERALALIVARDALTAYWRAVYLNELVSFRNREAEIAREVQGVIGDLVQAGDLSGIDNLESDLSLTRAEEAAIDAEEQAAEAVDQLWFVSGASRTSEPPEADELAFFAPLPTMIDWEGALHPTKIFERVIDTTPRTVALVALLERAKENQRRSRRDALPTLDLVASARRLEEGPDRDIDYTGQIQLEFPLFLREQRALLRRAEAELFVAEAELESERQVVREEIRAACRELESARRRLAAAVQGRDAARRLLEENRNLLDLGLVSARDLSEALLDYQSSETRVLAIRLDLALAQVNLATLDGSLLPAHGYDWPREETSNRLTDTL